MTDDILDMGPEALAAEIRARFDSLKIAMDTANARSNMSCQLWLKSEFGNDLFITSPGCGLEMYNLVTTVRL